MDIQKDRERERSSIGQISDIFPCNLHRFSIVTLQNVWPEDGMQSEFTAPSQKGCRKSVKDFPCGFSTTEKARPAPSAEHISDTLLACEEAK